MARKKKDYTDVAKQLIDIVGKDNVVSLTHCETRLRFVVKNRKKIDDRLFKIYQMLKGSFMALDNTK
jgi:PTS system sucrose-specific IIC component